MGFDSPRLHDNKITNNNTKDNGTTDTTTDNSTTGGGYGQPSGTRDTAA